MAEFQPHIPPALPPPSTKSASLAKAFLSKHSSLHLLSLPEIVLPAPSNLRSARIHAEVSEWTAAHDA
eukprot:IDg1764t1